MLTEILNFAVDNVVGVACVGGVIVAACFGFAGMGWRR